MRWTRGMTAGLLAAALLAGCSKQQPAAPEPEANIVEEAPRPAPPPPREAEPAPPKMPDPAGNIADMLPPDEPPSPDEQMLEDADATGLTARTAPPDVVTDPPADPVGDLISNDGVGT